MQYVHDIHLQERKAKSQLNRVRKQLDRLTETKGVRRGKYRKSTRSKATGPVNGGLKRRFIDGQINQNQERGYKRSKSNSSENGRNEVRPISKGGDQSGYCLYSHEEGKCRAALSRCYGCKQIRHFVKCCSNKGKGDEAKRDYVKEIHSQRANGKKDVWILAVHLGNASLEEKIKVRSGRDVRRNGGGENRVHITNHDARIDERNLESLFGRYGSVNKFGWRNQHPVLRLLSTISKRMRKVR